MQILILVFFLMSDAIDISSCSKIIVLLVFSELFIELVGFFPLQGLLDSDPACHIEQREQDAAGDQLWEEGERGYLSVVIPEVCGQRSMRKVASLTM